MVANESGWNTIDDHPPRAHVLYGIAVGSVYAISQGLKLTPPQGIQQPWVCFTTDKEDQSHTKVKKFRFVGIDVGTRC